MRPWPCALADAIATRADVDALLSVAISARQEDGAAEDSPLAWICRVGELPPIGSAATKAALQMSPGDREAEQLIRWR